MTDKPTDNWTPGVQGLSSQEPQEVPDTDIVPITAESEKVPISPLSVPVPPPPDLDATVSDLSVAPPSPVPRGLGEDTVPEALLHADTSPSILIPPEVNLPPRVPPQPAQPQTPVAPLPKPVTDIGTDPSLPTAPSLSVTDVATDPSIPPAKDILPLGNLLTDTNPSLPPASAVSKILAQKSNQPTPMQEADTRPTGLKAEVEANLRAPTPAPQSAPAVPAPSPMPRVSSGESTLTMGSSEPLERTLQDSALPKAPLPRAAQEQQVPKTPSPPPSQPRELKAWESAPTTVDPVPTGSVATPHSVANAVAAPTPAPVPAPQLEPALSSPPAESPDDNGIVNLPQSIERAESELDISDPAVSLAKRFRINPFESETNPSLLTGDNVFTEIAKHAHSAAQTAAEIFETSSAAYFSEPTPPPDRTPMSPGLSVSAAATASSQFRVKTDPVVPQIQPEPEPEPKAEPAQAAQAAPAPQPEPRERSPEAQALGQALTQSQPAFAHTQAAAPEALGLEQSNPEWLADLATPIPQPPMFDAKRAGQTISSGASLLRPMSASPSPSAAAATAPAPEQAVAQFQPQPQLAPEPEDALPEVHTPRDLALNSDTALSVRTPVAAGGAAPVAVPTSMQAPEPEPSAPAPEEFDDSGGDTLMLDREQQDKLMELRAQQDELLREQMGEQVVVMFTDLVGSTAYYEKFGDLMGRQKMLTHNALLFPIIREFEGTVIKTIGDSIMACFPSSLKGLDAAEKMQQALRAFNANTETPEDQIHIRIGLNAGHAIPEDGDLHGDAVNVASRVQTRAASDEILVAESMLFEAPDRTFDLLGPVSFKGKADPIKVYRFRWEGDGERSEEKPGTLGGRYALGEIIGRGPMAVVYASNDEHLDIKVAVKVFHGFLAKDISGDQDFSTRVRTMARLQHPNILRTLDFSRGDVESPYYVTEYLDALDLAAYIARNGQPTVSDAVDIVLDIAKAVAHGHGKEALHTNLKPQNVLVTPERFIKVADFGMARIRATQVTNSGNPLGPPAYQAPEQVVGGGVDERTDVYSVGAVLYFLLAGRPPYEGSATFHALRAVASGLFKPLNRVRPDLPPDLVEVCNTAMAHKKENRYTSVGELIVALQPFSSVAAPPQGARSGSGPQWQSVPATQADQPLTTSGEATIKMAPYAPAEGTDPAQQGILDEEARGRRASRKIAPIPTPRSGADHRPAIAMGVAAMLVVAVALGYGMRLRANRSAPVVAELAQPDETAVMAVDPTADDASPTDKAVEPQELEAIPPSPTNTEVSDTAAPQNPQPQPAKAKSKQAKAKAKQSKKSVPVKISVKPWADVTINGTSMGRAKGTMEVELPPGKHTIKLVGPKRRTYAGDFVVVAGKPNLKKFKLPTRPPARP